MIFQNKPDQQLCNDDKLIAVLNDGDQAVDHQQVVEHIEQCPRCQQRFDELAAGAQDWTKVRQALRNDDAYSEKGVGTAKWIDSLRNEVPTAWTESMATQLFSPASHPELLGRLGRYDVERLIGSGGMGIVFKAHDSELNRPVAIKILAPYLSSSGPARKRFAREARAAAAVVHEHVVPIYNVETEREIPYLVMHYIAGESLQGRIDREGALELCETLRIGMQVAYGLSAAHQQGLVHRDIKPSNILMEQGVERALITDFGLARAADDASLTRTGFHPGTPQYMSPEQANGEQVDARSDLFSLGSVLYTMCTGRPPFRAETSLVVLRRITDVEPRPIREINPDIPEWLCAIISKLMAKQADGRFDSAREAAELLEECLAHVQQPNANSLPATVVRLIKSLHASSSSSAAQSSNEYRYPPIVKLIASAAFAFSLIFAGVLIVLELNKGTLTITSDVDGVPIRIKQGDRIVKELSVSKAGEVTRIAAGQYVVEVVGEFSSVSVEGSVVSLRRGETEIVKVVRNAHRETVSLENGNSVVREQSTKRMALGREIGTTENSETVQVVFKGPPGLLVETMQELAKPQARSLTSVNAYVDRGPCPSRWNLSTSSNEFRRLILTRIPGRDELRVLPILMLNPAVDATRSWLEHNAIPIEFTTEDFDQVLLGKLVTKVIYLPRPEFQQQANGGIETLVSTQLLPDTHPILEAQRRGDVIAVLQIEDYDKLATATCKGMPLEEAVRNLNAKLSRQPHFPKQPPLTVDEVVACTRWNLSLLKDEKYKHYRAHYQKLVEDRVLDGGSFHADVVKYTEGKLTVYTFQIGGNYMLPLNVVEGDVQHYIRRRYIKAEVENEATTLFTNGKPLTESIAEFNQICKEKDPDQPPLTEDEVLAALRNTQFENWIDKPANMSDEMSALIRKTLSDRELPEGVEFVLNTDFQSGDGSKYKIWRPSIRISTSDMAEPRTIPLRTHFISSFD